MDRRTPRPSPTPLTVQAQNSSRRPQGVARVRDRSFGGIGTGAVRNAAQAERAKNVSSAQSNLLCDRRRSRAACRRAGRAGRVCCAGSLRACVCQISRTAPSHRRRRESRAWAGRPQRPRRRLPDESAGDVRRRSAGRPSTATGRIDRQLPSSVVGRILPTYTAYAATRAALEAMTFILAHELQVATSP